MIIFDILTVIACLCIIYFIFSKMGLRYTIKLIRGKKSDIEMVDTTIGYTGCSSIPKWSYIIPSTSWRVWVVIDVVDACTLSVKKKCLIFSFCYIIIKNIIGGLRGLQNCYCRW